MSHEIYYTSAPEGLKRGTSGFCTVAASENIPKALWDRLETLSAYRHLTGAGAADVGGGGGANPVSFAHWMLTVTGKTHHVLSRVCDSGVDHTQRTNAFAHHIVLDPADMQRAAGGPAWVLQQGPLAKEWDGRVGNLPPSRLPAGTGAPAGVCRAWATATGDAGWGGHLADLFVKSPTRPVCILFSPGQDILPLIVEAIALLPPAARWNVTFNTYFTSMPTSATCLWRCCAVGTQAADIGQRYAANGLILNLADASHLGMAPDGPLAAVARSGAATVTRAATAQPAKTAAIGTPPRTAAPGSSLPDEEDLADERRREAIFEFADEPAKDAEEPLVLDQSAEDAISLSPVVPARGRQMPARIAHRADEVLEEAEREAAQAAARRRKQVLVLFIAAVGAIGIGTILMIAVARHGAPPDAPRVERPPGRTIDVPIPQPPAPTVESQPMPTVAQTRVVQTARQPDPLPLPPVPVPIVYPDLLTTYTALEAPSIGTGIGDRSQTLSVSKTDIDPARVAGLRLILPETAKAPSNTGAASYQLESLGTFSTRQQLQGIRPSLLLAWKGPQDAAPVEIGSIQWDATKGSLEFQWHAALLLKYPGMFNLIYWLAQNSSLELQSPRTEKQRIKLKPFLPPAQDFGGVQGEIAWPVPMPADVIVLPPAATALPTGWTAERYFDWASKDAAARTPENALQVIKFKKPSGVGIADAIFTLTFKPGLGKIESDFARQLTEHENDLKRFESELRSIDQQPDERNLQEKRAQTAALVDAYKNALAGYNELIKFDLSFELPDGMRLATAHFQRTAKEPGK